MIKMTRYRSFFFLAIVMLSMNVAHSSSSERQSLRDVQKVGVVVNLDSSLSGFISEHRLKTVVELALRQAGLEIAEGPDSRDGNLVLSILALPDTSNERVVGFSASRRLQFYQGATLSRTDQFLVIPTWERWTVSYWGRERVREAAERVTREGVDEFINDLLAAR